MIKEILLKNVASYSEQGGSINNLSNVNFFYGANGTGKSTISRYLFEVGSNSISEKYSQCEIAWDSSLDILVYNQDFRDRVYHTEHIPGVFTLGQATNEQLEHVRHLKQALQEQREGLTVRRNTLKQKEAELKQNHHALKEAVWEMFKQYDRDFKEVFSGFRNNKERLLEELLGRRNHNQIENNESKEELKRLYIDLYANTPTILELIPSINFQTIEAIEQDDIWEKAIIGNQDIDIAKLIDSLQMGDWINEGRQYIQANSIQCPFCQQDTITEVFRRKIKSYFDKSFQEDIDLIHSLFNEYVSLSQNIIEQVETITSPKLSPQYIQALIVRLKAHLNENIAIMEKKLKSPSRTFTISVQKEVFSNIITCIEQTNSAIQESNNLVQNIQRERCLLNRSVWCCLLRENAPALDRLIQSKRNAENAFNGILKSIEIGENKERSLKAELEQANRNVTSTQPAIDAINKQLESYGFLGFKIMPHPNIEHRYQICRQTGEPVTDSLSEGEITFITFLYFIQLVNGGLDDESVGQAKIVVVDDPISSLDSTILYIVSSILKELRNNVKCSIGDVKQLFILTHNVSFYRDVSFFNGRPVNEDASLSYYLIRKPNNLSKISLCKKNPIDSYYGLLWNELKQENNSRVSIQNIMRRILEYYFKILGGWKDEQIISQFPSAEEQDICRSLICWINDGSHTIVEDLYIEAPDIVIEKYKHVFKLIFEKSNHIAHYNMMMGIEQDEYNN